LNLLKSMIEVQSTKRIQVRSILKHDWVVSGYKGPVEWHSTFKKQELDTESLDIMSEYYKWSYTEAENKVREFKYDHITAHYLLLRQMSVDKRRQLRSSHKQQLGVDDPVVISLLNRGFDGTKRLNGYIPESSPHILRKPRSRTVADPTTYEQTVAGTSRRDEKSPSPVNPAITRIKAEQRLPSPKTDESNLESIQRFSTSCDNILNESGDTKRKQRVSVTTKEDTIEEAIHVAPSAHSLDTTLEHGRARSQTTRETSRSPGILAEFTQRLSGFFKGDSQPRRVKAIYNVENTSTLSPERVRNELQRVIALLIEGEVLSSYSNPEKFLFKCKAGSERKVVFELEVCSVPFMDSVVGIRRKRLKGDAWYYKDLVEKILCMARI